MRIRARLRGNVSPAVITLLSTGEAENARDLNNRMTAAIRGGAVRNVSGYWVTTGMPVEEASSSDDAGLSSDEHLQDAVAPSSRYLSDASDEALNRCTVRDEYWHGLRARNAWQREDHACLISCLDAADAAAGRDTIARARSFFNRVLLMVRSGRTWEFPRSAGESVFDAPLPGTETLLMAARALLLTMRGDYRGLLEVEPPAVLGNDTEEDLLTRITSSSRAIALAAYGNNKGPHRGQVRATPKWSRRHAARATPMDSRHGSSASG